MRHPRICAALLLALVLVIASAVAFAWAAGEERPPESLLPADSVAYFGWDGTEKHRADWERTACYESIDKTHLLRTVTEFAISLIPHDFPISQQTARELLESIARRGISVSVAVPKGQTVPQVVIVLHHGAGLQAGFDAAVPKLFERTARFEKSTIRGRHVNRGQFRMLTPVGENATALGSPVGLVAPPGPELAWWSEGGHLVIAFGEKLVEAALDVADGKTSPISQSANWRKFREEPSDFHAMMAGWCDIAALRERYGDYLLQEQTDRDRRFTVRQVIDVLGGEHLGSVAMRCGFHDRALVSDFVVEAPAPRTGLLALADQAPITVADLPPLPATTIGFGLASFNWSKAYDTILGTVRKFADTVVDQGSAKVDEAMQHAPEVLGFDPRTELVDALGHVACIYGDPAAGIPGGLGFTLALSVEKPEALQKTLKIGIDKLQTVFPNGFSAAQEERSGRPTWVFDLSEFPIHPAAALDKHWLFVGFSPQSIESAFLRLDGKLDRWKPSEADQLALNSVPKQFVGLTLFDPRPIFSTVLSYAPIGARIINQAIEANGQGSGGAPARRAANARMALLADIPPVEVVTKPLFPNATATTVDAKGIRMQSRESVGWATGGVAGAPVVVALLLPAVQAAREAARRTQSRNNAKQILLALYNYHNLNDHFPAGTHPNAGLKPDKRLSWQAEILPYVEMKPVYDMIDFKKAWDDPANRKAAEVPLSMFANPSVGEQKVNGLPATEYVGMAGVGADGATLPVTSPRAGVFAYDRVTRISDIKDGTSTTIMIGECHKDLGPWIAGGRATIRALTKKPYIDGPDGLGGEHPVAWVIGLADGSVRAISTNTDPKVLESLMTIAGGERIGDK